jgi:tRNA dimethylallyltransferase
MSDQQKYLIVVGGPTASGKTALAIRLAAYFQAEILSADSRQFFREMSIGTAKPSIEELQQVPHHFINSHSVLDNYNVGDFERDALALLKQLYIQHNCAILVGGSGLYIKALCEGLDEFPDVPAAVRAEVDLLFKNDGLEGLQRAVAEADPDYYAVVDQQNPNRLVRALAVFRASGQPFSSFWQKNIIPRPFQAIYLWLDVDRAHLYERINQRVDDMVEKGLVEEARALLPYRGQMALETVGYQELFDFFEGQTDLDSAIELIKRNSRRYAKRQLTWMRRDGFWGLFTPDDWEGMLDYLKELGLIN